MIKLSFEVKLDKVIILVASQNSKKMMVYFDSD